jgi:ATP-binding cassette, subfamily C, bacterial
MKRLPSGVANVLLLQRLFMDLYRSNPFGVCLTGSLILFRSVSAGVGLLLIIPLLQVMGMVNGAQTSNGIAHGLQSFFAMVHVPLSLVSLLMSYVVIVSVVAVAAFVEQVMSARLQQQFTHRLRAQLYHQLLKAEWPFFLKRKSSDLLHGLTVQIQAIAASNVSLLTLLNHLILMVVYLSLAFLLSWSMTLVACLCALLLLSIMLPLHQRTSAAGRTCLQKNQSIFQSISEHLGALKMIKSAGLEAYCVERTVAVSLSLEAQNQQLIRMTAATKLLYSCGSVLVFSVLLYVAIELFKIPMASLFLLLVVFARLFPMVSTLQQTYQRLLHQLPSFVEVNQLMQDCLAHEEWLEPREALTFQKAILLKDVSFSYPSTSCTPVIEQLSIQLKKNTTTAITAPSGAGKSTLADLIVGLLNPTAGHIFIDDVPLSPKNKLAWRKSIAYVNQTVFLFNDTLRANLCLFCQDASDEALMHALQAASAAEFVEHLTDGLDTVVGERGVRLSGGEAQRIALARALLSQPQLLILDESTSSLDTHNIVHIQNALKKLQGTMTILMITHQAEMSGFADQHIKLGVKGC